MKRALTRRQSNPYNTPATTPSKNAGAPPDRVRATLTLIEPAAGQKASAATRPFKSFEGDAKAEAKALLQTLEFQLAIYPQFAGILALAIEPLRAETRRKPKSDRNLVLDVIAAFDSVPIEELLDDTHLSLERICTALLNLIELGLVDCRTSGKRSGTKLDPSFKELLEHIFAREDHCHLKRDYRAEYLFCVIHTPAGSNFTSPARAHSSTRAMGDFLQD